MVGQISLKARIFSLYLLYVFVSFIYLCISLGFDIASVNVLNTGLDFKLLLSILSHD